jgi:hypothetical protein
MAIGGLGVTEMVLILLVFLLTVGVPILAIVALILFLNKRRNSNVGMKKCVFCAYSIPIEAVVCRFCGRELGKAGD